MKKLLSTLLIILIVASVACLTLVALVGCTRNGYEKITKINEYKDMQEGGDKIEVSYYYDMPYYFYFSIEDKDTIDELVDLILNTSLVKQDMDSMPVGASSFNITVYQGENVFKVSTSCIYVGKVRYVFSTKDIFNKVYSVATTKGLAANRYGMIYKVVDSQDLVGVKYEEITNLDNDDIMDLIESDFADYDYFYVYQTGNENAEVYYSSNISENESPGLDYKSTFAMEDGQLLLIYYICRNSDGLYYITRPSSLSRVDESTFWTIAAGAIPSYVIRLGEQIASGIVDYFFGN